MKYAYFYLVKKNAPANNLKHLLHIPSLFYYADSLFDGKVINIRYGKLIVAQVFVPFRHMFYCKFPKECHLGCFILFYLLILFLLLCSPVVSIKSIFS